MTTKITAKAIRLRPPKLDDDIEKSQREVDRYVNEVNRALQVMLDQTYHDVAKGGIKLQTYASATLMNMSTVAVSSNGIPAALDIGNMAFVTSATNNYLFCRIGAANMKLVKLSATV